MRMTPNGPFEEPDDDLADLNVYGSHVEEDDDEDDLDDAYDEGDYDAAPGALPLPISDSQQRSLQRTLDEALQSHGCDGSLRATEAWAAARGIGWPRLRRALEASGGYCDCEVLMNDVVPPEPDDLEGLLPDELADGDSTTYKRRDRTGRRTSVSCGGSAKDIAPGSRRAKSVALPSSHAIRTAGRAAH